MFLYLLFINEVKKEIFLKQDYLMFKHLDVEYLTKAVLISV